MASEKPIDRADVVFAVTNPSGRAHTHGADDGRTGWRRHALASEEAADRGDPAACGLRPRHGWGTDLFEKEMLVCRSCERVMADRKIWCSR